MTTEDDIKTMMTKLRSSGGGIRDAMAVARLGSNATPFLIEASRDQDARVRGLSCLALGQSVPTATVEIRVALEARLRDEEHEVRWVAVRALGNMKLADPSTLANIEALRRSDSNEAVRNAAGEAILEITGKAPTPLRDIKGLLASLDSNDKVERENAINEIGLLGVARAAEVKHKRVLKRLIDRLLCDDYFQCRSSAALALQWIGEVPVVVIDALAKALDDKELLVQSHAVAALGSFGPAAAPGSSQAQEARYRKRTIGGASTEGSNTTRQLADRNMRASLSKTELAPCSCSISFVD
jgi:HEAT repeat protein